TAPATLNAANEVAVSAFLQGRIGFLSIAALVEDALAAIAVEPAASLEALRGIDARARRHAERAIATGAIRWAAAMTAFRAPAWWLVVSLGILVTIHEFGHFWVARRCGVRVLRFSIGFGRALWRRLGADGTEYRVAAIPLGGYVKMLDEREYEVPEADAGQ